MNIAFLISVLFFILDFVSGFLFGFQKSLSNTSLIHIIINGWKVILPICGMEIMRYKLLRRNKNNFGFKAFITIIIILSEINFKALFLSRNIDFFYYLTSIIIPIIAQNILCTYLSCHSHYNTTIIIKIFHELPNMILPMIPYRDWFMAGTFDIIQDFILYYVFQSFIFRKKTRNHVTHASYLLTIIISILFVSFMLGLFSYQPIAILSNSMNPTFQRGDIVIYKKEDKIVPGDIIVFQYQNQIIVHRVIYINEYYITKGDANNTVDYIKVQKEDIKGVYQFSIQYLGYPSIWLHEWFTKENEFARKQ